MSRIARLAPKRVRDRHLAALSPERLVALHRLVVEDQEVTDTLAIADMVSAGAASMPPHTEYLRGVADRFG